MLKVIDVVAKVLNALAAACLLFLILSASADVAALALTGRGLRGSIEYGEVVLVMLAFFGLARTQQTDGHVAVDLVTTRLPPRWAAGLEFAALSVALVFIAWTAWASVVEAIASVESGEYRFGVVQVPIWPARVAIAVGLLALVAVIAAQLVRLARKARSREDEAALPEHGTSQRLEHQAF